MLANPILLGPNFLATHLADTMLHPVSEFPHDHLTNLYAQDLQSHNDPEVHYAILQGKIQRPYDFHPTNQLAQYCENQSHDE
jgi:hypothetical protein